MDGNAEASWDHSADEPLLLDRDPTAGAGAFTMEADSVLAPHRNRKWRVFLYEHPKIERTFVWLKSTCVHLFPCVALSDKID